MNGSFLKRFRLLTYPDMPFSKELQFLVSASLSPNKPFSGAMQPDPNSLLKLAQRHQVRVMLYDYLGQNPIEGGEEILDPLKRYSVEGAVYNMVSLKQSIGIVYDFEKEGLQVFLMKGALWAWMLYEKPSLREFGDIDYFFQKKDITQGLAVLARHGYHADDYRQFLLADAHVAALYFKEDYQLPLVPGPDALIQSLEVQWNTTYPRFAFSFGYDELMARPMAFDVPGGGQQIMVPSKEHQLLMMVIHHAGVEQWDKLKYMADFVRMLRKFGPEMDWDYIGNKARQKGFYRLLLESLGLAEELTGEKFLKYGKSGMVMKYPTASFKEAVYRHWEHGRMKPKTKSWQIFYFNMRYRDHWRVKAKILASHLAYLLEWRLLIPKAKYYRKNR
ncbi:putative nucleotidyltransferase-like protein [Dyadobacter jejuensis]|uniref:Putative nucleotidyltransferase-like protein n=2 Tax=Dyadobacter jejuensis TaxID=1082580 RepID=A0A316AN81_9BACT|nr:putative nucleotidyltransferase-like protein [Dyadobacter jejuensis]